ncbi:MAG: TraB/GumN family protein [Crocinitomicaceae bacterium]|mgnify:FL=1|nr:TraB/GumN family protein [Crocinitomicaceae bacterium]
MFLIFIFLFPFASFSQEKEIQYENKLLWEITTKGKKEKSYLFGSFHTNDKRVFQLSDSVYVALNNSKAIVLETDIYAMFKDWDTRYDYLNLEYDNEGKPYTKSSSASRTSYGDEDGMPQFLDLYFMQYGFNANKNFYALEAIEDQMSLVENPFNFSYSYADQFIQAEDKAINLYLSGNVDALERLLRTSLKWNPDFFDNLITKRNLIMADGIDSLLKKENLFIAIGAGHLGGEKGVINLLRSKGHHLRPVLYTKSKEAIPEKLEVLSNKSYNYFDSITQLHAVFPGKPFDIDKEGVVLNLIYREMGQGNSYSIEVIAKEEGQTLQSVAMDYIQSPGDSKKTEGVFDDETRYIEGISDSYPEGISWVRVIDSDHYFAILKAYGGNKFMNSPRPKRFFDNIWFEYPEEDNR